MIDGYTQKIVVKSKTKLGWPERIRAFLGCPIAIETVLEIEFEGRFTAHVDVTVEPIVFAFSSGIRHEYMGIASGTPGFRDDDSTKRVNVQK